MTRVRQLWGIQLKTLKNDRPIGPLFDSWHDVRQPFYEGEPTRPLLFVSRRLAREWCKQRRARYADREDDCAQWYFKPIRVKESLLF